jgi:hypothetical protein
MTRRCPSAKLVSRTYLTDHRLEFWRVCNVVYEKGSKLPVVIWQINDHDLLTLDRYEGVNSNDRLSRNGAYRRERCNWKQGQQAMIYVKNWGSIEMPDPQYFDRVRNGYKEHGFDLATLEDAWRETCKALTWDRPIQYRPSCR